MEFETFITPVLVRETYLDLYGHVNNAYYLKLYEEARWDFITANGYGLNRIRETGKGPIILGINIQFRKELKAREEILIISQAVSYERKICKVMQKMERNGEICSTADITLGLFDVKTRKLILPTQEWLEAIGAKHIQVTD